MTPALQYDSRVFPPDQQFATYRQFLPACDMTVADPTTRFTATAEAWLVGTMLFSVTRAETIQLVRTAERARADGLDHYSFLFLREGSWTGDFDGLNITSAANTVLVADATRPSTALNTPCELVRVLVSRDLLDGVLAPFDMHGMLLTHGAGGLIRDHLDSVVRRLPEIPDTAAGAVELATRDLLAACMEGYRPADSGARANRPVLARAKRYIAGHLEDPLTVEEICVALGASRASLYRAFEPLGGVAAYVQKRRLARIHALLSRPDEHRSMSQLAYAFGFVSGEHFSRRFRKQYGYPATALRASVRPTVAHEPGSPDPATLLRQFRRLG